MNVMDYICFAISVIALIIALVKIVKGIITLAKDKTLYLVLVEYLEEAEKTGKTGEEKLNIVKEKLEQYAETQNIKLDIDYIVQLINRIIAATKKINI